MTSALCRPTLIQRSFASQSPVSWNLPESAYTTHRCDKPKLEMTTTKEEALNFYRTMNVIRRIELSCDTLYKSGLIRGFLHLYLGQEAISTGVETVLGHKHHVIGAYRIHGWAYTRGISAKEMLAELTGRAAGSSKGKGGSMHLYRGATNFHGGNGIVGAQCPIGAGIAFAQQYLKQDTVTFSLYGDGAANQGQLHEAFNMSALWKLPVVYVCENNGYAMGTSVSRSTSNPDYFTHGNHVPGMRVDAVDVYAVKRATEYAVQHALAHGPLVLEFSTYRYSGHSISDPGTSYRTREEVNEMRQKRDPISRLKAFIEEHNLATADELKEIDRQVKAEVDEAAEFAKTTPEPDPSELFTHVYTDLPVTRGVEYHV
eukprot:TRINITY_DN1089_c0_g1_i2.p1 TRINITY_DN1089_c0_g1~~TRINITY_DN1089_c0_g1_i2.p1  ORF type:complete len:398 (-),score=95.79 TRINITY_DN1089_c0_g1_i2:57-1172(-)